MDDILGAIPVPYSVIRVAEPFITVYMAPAPGKNMDGGLPVIFAAPTIALTHTLHKSITKYDQNLTKMLNNFL
jgi:hypothetical protein